MDYSDERILDAYIVTYLPRNTLVPMIALNDLLMNPAFRKIPKEFKVLDIGSGTGAVVLGLLELFHLNPLNKVNLSITAIDQSKKALERQNKLIAASPFCGKVATNIDYHLADFSINEHFGYLDEDRPYNWIFISNLLTETPEVDINEVLRLSNFLTDDGIMVVVEPSISTGKTNISSLARTARQQDLSIYYPCSPEVTCGRGQCWVWRYHKFILPKLPLHIPAASRDHLTASWLILCKNLKSIYDTPIKNDGKLSWRPICHAPSRYVEINSATCQYKYCNGQQELQVENPKNCLINRGDVVGISLNDQNHAIINKHIKLGATPD